jgi:hypothetical protein
MLPQATHEYGAVGRQPSITMGRNQKLNQKRKKRLLKKRKQAKRKRLREEQDCTPQRLDRGRKWKRKLGWRKRKR